MKKILLLLIFFVCSYANFSSKEISEALKMSAIKYNIDKKILYTIAKIESGFNSNIIAFISKKKWIIKGKNIIVKNFKYKNNFLIQVRGDLDSLKKISSILIKNGYKIDVGLMQINSQNFKLDELDFIFEPKYNISKSISVLKNCKEKFKILKDTVECYNKGTNIGKKYNYYNKFVENYIKDFG
ncbi:lytic transglycosylase domain-containing protein [Campylobacter lari]|uniref:Lytic transglycosylase domain-containing protein n=1 Tax=Campylobacter peloridis TaxID=488546 RepID=A0A5C7DTI2_9BACT|nr:transglycosylase SLT domain-containing protein [Campylobacter peloridis]EAH8851399.1 hypothetical protein [Campylobacter lari]EAK5749158.1 lytic transglycosylase domain-containing protein [Campylobacter lari]EAK9878352.1 lytic transglycosylase domain-containing protein [Campylobacter lari]TXE78485.1 lytic transglycosylase domain-containing protein [Campylobacter peloridis]